MKLMVLSYRAPKVGQGIEMLGMREVQERRAQRGWGPGSSAPRSLMSRKCAFSFMAAASK